MQVAVIGSGPAGLAAAHAASGLGCDVYIYSDNMAPSPQRGPLLIQRPIPGINTGHPDGTIHQRVIGGSILDYRYKLYGDINIGINGDILKPEYHAWDHRATYSALWRMYGARVKAHRWTGMELIHAHEDYDLVVSTASTRDLCLNGSHKFAVKKVFVANVASYPEQPDDTIIFNAGPEYPWVRSSRIFGFEVTEWADDPYQIWNEHAKIEVVNKPISTDCDCFPRVLRTGRFGAWKNEVWVDTAYWDTYSAISSMMRREELDAIK